MAKAKGKKGRGIGIVIAMLFLVMIVSGTLLVLQLLEYTKGNEQYEGLRKQVQVTETGNPKTPDAKPVFPMKVDFDMLMQGNPDFVGWIYSPDTVISYPVLQRGDNDYYLNHLFDKTENKMGSIFMDKANAADYSDQNTILYGHHMKDGSMFASLVEYEKQAYYDQHKVLYYATPTGNYQVELVAGFLAEGDETVPINFGTEQERVAYYGRLRERSDFQSTVELQAKDRLLTLYTCAYNFNDARYILFGRLVPFDVT